MKYTHKLIVSKARAKKWAKIAQQEAPVDRGVGILEQITVKFSDGSFADLNLRDGEGPYIDPVLFDAHGNEIGVLDVVDELTGTYEWEVDDDMYVLKVSVKRAKTKGGR